MKRLLSLSFVLFLVVCASTADAHTTLHPQKALVLVDDLSYQKSHTKFFSALEDLGFNVQIDLVYTSNAELMSFGDYNFGLIVFMSPSASRLPNGITVEGVRKFVDSGRNVIFMGGPKLTTIMAQLAEFLGTQFPADAGRTTDHFKWSKKYDDGTHGFVELSDFSAWMEIAHTPVSNHPLQAVYSGSSFRLLKDNEVVFPIFKGHKTTYTPLSSSRKAAIIGESSILVAGIQGRNNARGIVSGSAEFFGDDLWETNGVVALGIMRWVGNEVGILRIASFKHYSSNDMTSKQRYRIKDNLTFELNIEEWDGDAWVPTKKIEGIQMSFNMLSPYIRMPMEYRGNGLFAADFVVPDVYGVYKFVVHFRKLGLSFLDLEEQVGIRPFNTAEFERFIPAAFSYYMSSFVVMVGCALTTTVFVMLKK